MKITPVTGPGAIKDLSTPEHVRTARAVTAFNNAGKVATPQAQETPVQDPSNVSVEELSAIQAPEIDKNTETVDAKSQEETPETPAETTKAEPKQDPELVERFNRLARNERALRAKVQQQEQAFKAREEALKAREVELAAKDTRYTQDYISKSRIKQDALTALDEVGVTYDEITQQAASRQPTDPRILNTINQLQAKIADLEQKAVDNQKSYQEQQTANYQSAVKQIKQDAVALVKSNPQEYEAIAKKGTVKDVVELIEKTYHKTGTVLSVEEAAQEVENELIEEALKFNSLEKVKQRMAKSNASVKPSNQKTQAPAQTQMKTLTNATASSRKLSSKERAILAFKGELKP